MSKAKPFSISKWVLLETLKAEASNHLTTGFYKFEKYGDLWTQDLCQVFLTKLIRPVFLSWWQCAETDEEKKAGGKQNNQQ